MAQSATSKGEERAELRVPADGAVAIEKASTGIPGLDQITGGGLPRGRATLVCGGPGCGKTVLALEFLVRGAQTGEPGVFVAFDESAEDVRANARSLGFPVDRFEAEGRLRIEHIPVERSELEESGEYDLEGLFIQLGALIDDVGARRIALDTIETLFSGFSNIAILRSEIRRLLRWLRDRGLTVVLTGERSDESLSHHGLEEFVSDCVILLDHRVNDQVSTRRLRILKYRGSSHGTNEYPFLISDRGISVLPITALGLAHTVSNERVSTGIAGLDAMLDGTGPYRGSSILVTGTAGTGKTSIGGHFVDAACRRGERCLLFSFEESRDQIIRNLRSIGLDLERWLEAGLLHIRAQRPWLYGLEMHLATMHAAADELRPAFVVVDPISNLIVASSSFDVRAMLTRLIDHFKSAGYTAVFTSLSGTNEDRDMQVHVSSLMDTWIELRDLEREGGTQHVLRIRKSRGMAHSLRTVPYSFGSSGIVVHHEDREA